MTTDGRLVCNCESALYPKTAGKCWHLPAVASGAMGKPRIRYQPAPAPLPRAAGEALDDIYGPARPAAGPIRIPATAVPA